MSDFKTRLITEFDELSDKINKLTDFLGGEAVKNIDKDQRTLLGIQLQAMMTYLSCITARLERL